MHLLVEIHCNIIHLFALWELISARMFILIIFGALLFSTFLCFYFLSHNLGCHGGAESSECRHHLSSRERGTFVCSFVYVMFIAAVDLEISGLALCILHIDPFNLSFLLFFFPSHHTLYFNFLFTAGRLDCAEPRVWGADRRPAVGGGRTRPAVDCPGRGWGGEGQTQR